MEGLFIQFILGIIQGITEWLPVSSSAALTYFLVNYVEETSIELILKNLLWLHLGTFFAALIYFRKDVLTLTRELFHYKNSKGTRKKILNFLIVSTVISGLIGILFFAFLSNIEDKLSLTGKSITLLLGIFLLFTAFLQLSKKDLGIKKAKNLRLSDGIILGIAQGLAVIPGISRSGITVSSLLLKKFDDTTSLRLSFLMSLPIVLAGNIILNFGEFSLSANSLIALLSSFIFGILTIGILMNLSKKINFGWFALIFGFLMLVSVAIF